MYMYMYVCIYTHVSVCVFVRLSVRLLAAGKVRYRLVYVTAQLCLYIDARIY